ncbi:major facilitator superfamily protein, partial [Striga asiatica]
MPTSTLLDPLAPKGEIARIYAAPRMDYRYPLWREAPTPRKTTRECTVVLFAAISFGGQLVLFVTRRKTLGDGLGLVSKQVSKLVEERGLGPDILVMEVLEGVIVHRMKKKVRYWGTEEVRGRLKYSIAQREFAILNVLFSDDLFQGDCRRRKKRRGFQRPGILYLGNKPLIELATQEVPIQMQTWRVCDAMNDMGEWDLEQVRDFLPRESLEEIRAVPRSEVVRVEPGGKGDVSSSAIGKLNALVILYSYGSLR